MTGRRSCDLAIVGGGIIGAWCLHLAARRFPGRRIVLLERAKVAGGATAHSAGVSLAVGRSARERDLAGRSSAHYAVARHAFGLEASDAPAYWLAGAGALPDLRAAAVGFTVDPWDQGLVGGPGALRLTGRADARRALFHGGVATSFEPAAVATALIRHGALASSASVFEGVAAERIEPRADGVDLTLTDGSGLTAARAIVAVGPWLAQGPAAAIAPAAGIRIKKVVALHVDLRPEPGAPAIFVPGADAYLMPIPRRSQWLYSFRSAEWDVAPEGRELAIGRADREAALSVLGEFFPDAVGRCVGGRVFCDAYAPRSSPVVARRHGTPLVVVGAGGGAGFRLAPGLAEDAVSLLD